MITRLKSKSFGIICSLLMLAAFSCKNEEIATKTEEKVDMLDVATYKRELSKEISSGNFAELRKLINLDNAAIQTATVNGKQNKYFEVVVYQDSKPKAVVMGLVGKKNYYNTVFWLAESTSSGSGVIDVKTVDNETLGTIEVHDMRVANTTVAPPTTLNARAKVARSWWGCTTDCIGDAQIACNSNSNCTVLLIASNYGGAYVGAPGAGIGSIAAACGISCANNSNMDLLPQF